LAGKLHKEFYAAAKVSENISPKAAGSWIIQAQKYFEKIGT
jgi:hypothetical protein